MDDEYKAYFRKAEVLSILNRFEESLQCINLGVEKFPEKGILHFARGEVLFNLKNYREAIVDFEKSIKLHHEERKSFEYIGKCFYNLEEFSNSIKYFEKCVESSNGDHLYKFEMGVANFKLGHYDEA
jgi:tetratricopeptide (TPR) repeat protein